MNHMTLLEELLAIALDNSEIYNSSVYKELVDSLHATSLKLSINNELLQTHQSKRVELEKIFYKYGFVEGLRFSQNITKADMPDYMK